jgi:periplasmic protein CpxP/Spy
VKEMISRRRVAMLAAVLMAGAMAAAQGPGGGPGMGGPFGEHRPPMERAFGTEEARGQFWNNPKVVEKLKLTDDQRKAMDGILDDHRMTLIDLRASLEKAEVAMQPLMRADDPNENAILAQIDKIAQARAELEKANARFLLAIRSKLTPDQWKQVQQFREDRPEPGRGQWGRGGQGPGGSFRRPEPPQQPPAGGQQPSAPAPQPQGSGDSQ